jgi:hypothetical protein
MSEEAKARGHTLERLTSGRCPERDRGASAATRQHTGSQAPEGGLARYSLEQRPAPGLRPPHAPGPSHATWRGQTSMPAPTPMDGLGFSIRQYRAGTHQAGKGPRGHQRLGFNPLITPAKANVETHLAELGRISRRGRAGPQAALTSSEVGSMMIAPGCGRPPSVGWLISPGCSSVTGQAGDTPRPQPGG